MFRPLIGIDPTFLRFWCNALPSNLPSNCWLWYDVNSSVLHSATSTRRERRQVINLAGKGFWRRKRCWVARRAQNSRDTVQGWRLRWQLLNMMLGVTLKDMLRNKVVREINGECCIVNNLNILNNLLNPPLYYLRWPICFRLLCVIMALVEQLGLRQEQKWGGRGETVMWKTSWGEGVVGSVRKVERWFQEKTACVGRREPQTLGRRRRSWQNI